jgi:capsule polysaccharide export protein KpsE/RkpR
MADLYASMLKSESVKDPIIDRFNLMEVFKNKYRTDTYKALERNTVIMTNKKDGIVTITVDDRDPKRAADIANSYVEELGNLAIRLNITGAVKNRAYLEERLTKARADLANAEDNLKEFQSKNKAVQITSQAEATIKGVADIRARLALQEVQLATYRRQFTESSQEVKNLVASIGNLKSQIAKLEGMGENSTIPSLGAVPALGQEYLRRMREFKIQESLVEVLTKQYEITRLSEARNVSPIQVIQKAKAPERKSKPSRSKFVIKATATIFFFSLIITFVLEHLSKMSDEDRTRWNDIWADLCFFRMKKL